MSKLEAFQDPKLEEYIPTSIIPYSEIRQRALIRLEQISDVTLELDKYNEEEKVLHEMVALADKALVLYKLNDDADINDIEKAFNCIKTLKGECHESDSSEA